jgi:peptidoglycan/LPS O-acetylase OafA/YrhL
VVDRRTEMRRRRWADVVMIVAALYAFLAAIWAPPGLGPAEAAADAPDHGTWWWAHAIGGSLALASVFVALRSTILARILGGLGGLVLLAGLLAFDGIGWLAIRTLVIPAVLILLATPFIGPMPTRAEEEGSVRAAGGGRGRP